MGSFKKPSQQVLPFSVSFSFIIFSLYASLCILCWCSGVPSLQRPELVTACEDFSNIIGSMLDGTVYKGTLSSGVEIAVTSTMITSAKDWTKKLETQFRNKVRTFKPSYS